MNLSILLFQFVSYFYSFLRLFNLKIGDFNKISLRYLSNNTKTKINQNPNFNEGYKFTF